jgi:hypothetical protein
MMATAEIRQLWRDSVKGRLGEEGYPWFVERANKHIADCNVCKGAGTVPKVPRKDELTSTIPQTEACHYCSVFVYRLEEFAFTYFLRMPAHYRKYTLKGLQPFEGTTGVVSMERQQTILDRLRAEPESGWLFFGPPHAGKTVWTTALYAHNLFRYFIGTSMTVASDREKTKGKTAVWRIKAKELLDQHTEWSIRRADKDEDGCYTAPEPAITAEKIRKFRRMGVCSKLYLEEIDKVSMTDARTNNLFEIIDTLHEEEGVVVINSNLRPEEFTNVFGEQFTWRLGREEQDRKSV